MGHDDELAFQGSGPVLDRYLQTIERLRDAGWLRILIVTDHGYIHWPTAEEKNVKPPLEAPAYLARRAAAYPVATQFEGPQALAPGERWRVAFTHGAASFRAYGGLGYFHGGASLQEWIIPCVAIEWPVQAKPMNVTIQPIEKFLSQHQKLQLQVVAPNLLAEDNIPRRVEVIARNGQTQTILFRSEATTVGVAPGLVEVTLLAQPQAAERSTLLRVELRDAATETRLDTTNSKLMIELRGW